MHLCEIEGKREREGVCVFVCVGGRERRTAPLLLQKVNVGPRVAFDKSCREVNDDFIGQSCFI